VPQRGGETDAEALFAATAEPSSAVRNRVTSTFFTVTSSVFPGGPIPPMPSRVGDAPVATLTRR